MKRLPVLSLLILIAVSGLFLGSLYGKSQGFDQGFTAGRNVSLPAQFNEGFSACQAQF